MDLTRVLLATYLFQDLSPAEVDGIAAPATVRRFGRGEHVFNIGDPADEIWVVASGQIRESTVDDDGNEHVTELLAAGAVFGEPGAFAAERTRVVNEVAVVASEVVRIPRDALFTFLLRHPPAMLRLLEGLSSEVRIAVEDVPRMAHHGVHRRVVDRLLLMAGTHGVEVGGSAVRIEPRLSQGELAAMVGCTRENANRVLSTLAARGLVRCKGGTIVILDLPALQLAAGGPQPALHRRNRRVDTPGAGEGAVADASA